MTWFEKIEKKYSKYAIRNLMWYIIVLYAFGFVIEIFWPDVYSTYLALNAQKVLHGEVWRVITFIMQPPSTSLIWIVFSLYMYYMIGTVLENVWGAFRFNIYFFMGVILNVVASIVVYLIFGVNMSFSTHYINLALFMAFAMVAPDTQLLLFFIIPVKMKWLAYFDGIYLLLTVICGYLTPVMPYNILIGCIQLGLASYGTSYGQVCFNSYVNSTSALISMLNFVVFLILTKTGRRTKGQKAFRKAMKARNKNITIYRTEQGNETGKSEDGGQGVSSKTIRIVHTKTRHRCAVCGRTEADGDDLEFRFCSKCDGNYEYCNEHLYTHIHVKNEKND